MKVSTEMKSGFTVGCGCGAGPGAPHVSTWRGTHIKTETK